MEESEKTTALKKAYADIILSTAKEAAARVMVSEKQAFRFQQDLSSIKDEALRLLVRLKHMIDAKTIESEITSLNQQRRMDELEAQLHEAEDIITDLRTELKWVRDELEKTRINRIPALNAKHMAEDSYSPQIAKQELLRANTAVSNGRDTLLNQCLLETKCRDGRKQPDELGVSCKEDYYACETGLDVIMRSKEPELHKNGCTQRIRALEMIASDEIFGSSVDVDDQNRIRKSDQSTESRPSAITRCTVIALKARNMAFAKKPPRKVVKKPKKAGKLRKTGTLCRKVNSAPCRSLPVHPSKVCQTSCLHQCKAPLMKEDVKTDEDSHASLPGTIEKMNVVKTSSGLDGDVRYADNLWNDSISIIPKGKRNREIVTRDSIASLLMLSGQTIKPGQQSGNPPCGNEILDLAPKNAESSGMNPEIAENEPPEKALPCLDPGLTSVERTLGSISGSASVIVKALCRSRPAEITAEESEVKDNVVVLVKQEGKAVENPVVPSAELNSALVDLSSSHSQVKDTKASEGISNKAERNRVIKYTFQRKRKKRASSDADENISPEKSNVTMKLDEKIRDAQDSQGCMPIHELSRSSRQLAQVACQLVSLSGKKC